jgi:hypothetical protein
MLYHALLSAVEVRVLIGHCDGLAFRQLSTPGVALIRPHHTSPPNGSASFWPQESGIWNTMVVIEHEPLSAVSSRVWGKSRKSV